MQLGSLPILKAEEIADVNPIGQVTTADLEWKDDIESRLKKVEQMQNILMFAMLIIAILAITTKR
jgi:hypothetical protein